MILLLHDHDLLISKFSKYLHTNKIEFEEIEIKNIFESMGVNASLGARKPASIWKNKLTNETFNLSDFSGIYHNFLYPKSDMFNQFAPEDINYCRSEWFAYIIYELSKHQCTVNPVTPIGYFAPSYNLPNLYSIATSLSIVIPEHILFPDADTIKKSKNDYCFKQSIYDFTDYSVGYNDFKKAQIAVKIHSGAKLTAIFTETEYFAHLEFSDQTISFDLPVDLVNKCVKLLAKLNLKIAQLFFIYTTTDNIILYHVNPIIKYQHLGRNSELFFYNLHRLFEKAKITEPA